MAKLTHRDVLPGHRRRSIVGRERERRAFQQNLEREVPEYLYFVIHGQAGVGKSYLVEHYRALGKEHGVETALTNEAEWALVQEMPRSQGAYPLQ